LRRDVPVNIMLVDDDADSLEGLAIALEPAGYQCYKFQAPEKALAAYAPGQYDVVINRYAHA
jgi:DNA-binding response OmpR family regulator